MTAIPSVEELKARHAKACELKMAVDRPAIEAAMRDWLVAIEAPADTKVSFVSSSKEMASAARAARAASAASAARAASAASAAKAARAASAASAAMAASAAWDAWDAWDATWVSITAIGAVSLNDDKTASIWLPTLRAFEAGAFAFWVTDAEVFVATRPSVLEFDAERRLHSAAGPAFSWLDDIHDYYWHGTNIPAQWIVDRASLTGAAALACRNIEQRRAAIDMLGWPAILKELDAQIINADADPLIGTLVEVKLPDLRLPARFCKVTCGTGREFAIGVPRGLKTALAAQAWMQGVELKDFVKPEIRT